MREPEDLAALPNLGPASVRMLVAAGIADLATLSQLGALGAFVRVRANERGRKPSLNLLWALEGALSGRPWQDVAQSERARLLLELDAHDSKEKSHE